MYVPRHYHQIYPVMTSLVGFYLLHNLAQTYDVVITFCTLQLLAIGHEVWIVVLSYPYQRYITWVNTPVEKTPTIEPPNPAGWIPKAEPVVLGQGFTSLVRNENVATLPRFDKERNFAVTLLRMHEYDPNAVDLTEKKWVKTTKKFIREEFVAMLHKWETHGLIERKSTAKNSPYVVRRWDAVRLVAEGNPVQ